MEDFPRLKDDPSVQEIKPSAQEGFRSVKSLRSEKAEPTQTRTRAVLDMCEEEIIYSGDSH